MMRTSTLLMILASLASGQTAESSQYRYLYTFGSRLGIHPPKVLNRKAATAALGQGEHPYGLGYPVGVTTDLHGRVWITDSGTASVHIFDVATGGYKEIRSVDGTAFVLPSGIVTDRGGRVYVADSGLGNVFVFDENGEYDRPLVPLRSERLLEGPTAVAFSEDGHTIFVADPPRKAILALNREGEQTAVIHLPPEADRATGLIVVNNQLYLMGETRHRVDIFSPAGLHRGEMKWDGIREPMAFTFDEVSRQFLVGNPRIMVVEAIAEDGQGLGAFGQRGEGVDQMKHVDALHIDAKGRVYVVDSHEGKVLVFAGKAPAEKDQPSLETGTPGFKAPGFKERVVAEVGVEPTR